MPIMSTLAAASVTGARGVKPRKPAYIDAQVIGGGASTNGSAVYSPGFPGILTNYSSIWTNQDTNSSTTITVGAANSASVLGYTNSSAAGQFPGGATYVSNSTLATVYSQTGSGDYGTSVANGAVGNWTGSVANNGSAASTTYYDYSYGYVNVYEYNFDFGYYYLVQYWILVAGWSLTLPSPSAQTDWLGATVCRYGGVHGYMTNAISNAWGGYQRGNTAYVVTGYSSAQSVPGSGGNAFGNTASYPTAGVAGQVSIRYPNTNAKLSATTGTVAYYNQGGYHLYIWSTSGSFTV